MTQSVIEKRDSFKSVDGTEISYIMTSPESPGPFAAILCHGLPSDKDEYGFYTDFAKELANNGITNLRFDFRYNGDSEPGSLSDLTISQMINDIDGAYWQLVNGSNCNDISIIGTSCGGGVCAAWANRCKRDISKIFMNAPVLDWVYEVTGTAKNGTPKSKERIATETIDSLKKTGIINEDVGYGLAMLNEAVLFDYVREMHDCGVGITIYHGTEDTIVPFDISKHASEEIDTVNLVSIPKCDHGFAVGDDDYLTSPATKKNHQQVYDDVINTIISSK